MSDLISKKALMSLIENQYQQWGDDYDATQILGDIEDFHVCNEDKIIGQYLAIGTVEECREAMERQKPKIPNIWGDGYDDEGNMIYDMYDCPNCGKSYEVDYHDYKYCPECGQAIDRSTLDKLV